MNVKLERIFSNKLLVVSGWGTGLAFLFVIFSQRTGLSVESFRFLDEVLAFSVGVFFLLAAHSVSTAMKELEEEGFRKYPIVKFKTLFGGVGSLVLMLGGWFFSDYIQNDNKAMKTATAFGVLLFGSGFIVVYAAVNTIFQGDRNERA
ncbi:hypothetical protein NVV94_02480 [Pseudomonas sp. LS1212]|uniref:hypothetical protein n=1 Tax=Pseudomonas sp. LS1212 TaxID=2972478 RepID=UPI00215CE09C|nr:hypothetical protein [Pseudomonas sp. LS1212]UVJ44495.1 hypothetical protein NVV94_02480 [Pseudomonas sp. LS1212]